MTLSLPDIGAALDGDGGEGAVTADLLRRHRDRLVDERARLDRLAATVDRTLTHLEGGTTMDPAELFDGFDAQRQAAYEDELVDRLGEDVVPHLATSRRRVARMTEADAKRVQGTFADIDRRVAALMHDGAEAADPRVQEVLVDHYATVSMFWTPDRESYAGPGQLYVDSPDFRDRYEAVRPGLAEFLRDAMAVYAEERLT